MKWLAGGHLYTLNLKASFALPLGLKSWRLSCFIYIIKSTGGLAVILIEKNGIEVLEAFTHVANQTGPA